MIKLTHAAIRTAEPDDAPFLHTFYERAHPRAALLDNRREPLLPTQGELRELLGRKEAAQGQFYAVEDRTGMVQGFCSLRGMNPEASFGEFTLLLPDDQYDEPLAEDAFSFVRTRSFVNLHLQRLIAHALTEEASWRAFLGRQGFTEAGAFRQAFYSGGSYHDIHIYTLFDQPPVN